MEWSDPLAQCRTRCSRHPHRSADTERGPFRRLPVAGQPRVLPVHPLFRLIDAVASQRSVRPNPRAVATDSALDTPIEIEGLSPDQPLAARLLGRAGYALSSVWTPIPGQMTPVTGPKPSLNIHNRPF